MKKYLNKQKKRGRIGCYWSTSDIDIRADLPSFIGVYAILERCFAKIILIITKIVKPVGINTIDTQRTIEK